MQLLRVIGLVGCLLLAGCSQEPTDEDLFEAMIGKIRSINMENDFAHVQEDHIVLRSVKKEGCDYHASEIRDYYICTVIMVTTTGDQTRTGRVVVTVFFRRGEGWIAD